MKALDILLYSIVLTLSISCENSLNKEKIVYINTDSIKGHIIADTIIYDVIINNTNPDDVWTDQCLQYLNKQDFIEDIFQSIYSGKLSAYHFQTGEEFSSSYLKTMEMEDWFSREAIGKVQFKEVWYMDANHMVFNKQVLSLVLGVEQFTTEGKLKGYKPLFRVYLN